MVKGSHMTDEQRMRCSIADVGRRATDETRAKMSASHIGNVMSESTKELLLSYNLGSHHSSETRARQASAALVNMTPERKEKLRAVNLGSHHSEETKAKQSAALRGCLGGGWRGGVSSANHIIRTSGEYVTWRTAVFERDGFTCQDCGRRGGDLEAHHVHGFAKYPDERLVVANGVTLCLACHNKTKGKGELQTFVMAQEA